MNDESRPVTAWVRDLALAYAGGLVLGAPVALLAVWLTGYEPVATVCLLLAMAATFVMLRRRRPRGADGSPGSRQLERNSVPSRRAA